MWSKPLETVEAPLSHVSTRFKFRYISRRSQRVIGDALRGGETNRQQNTQQQIYTKSLIIMYIYSIQEVHDDDMFLCIPATGMYNVLPMRARWSRNVGFRGAGPSVSRCKPWGGVMVRISKPFQESEE